MDENRIGRKALDQNPLDEKVLDENWAHEIITLILFEGGVPQGGCLFSSILRVGWE